MPQIDNKCIASSGASLLKASWEQPEHGTFFGTTLRSMQQPMRRISWAASLCLPLPVDKNASSVPKLSNGKWPVSLGQLEGQLKNVAVSFPYYSVTIT